MRYATDLENLRWSLGAHDICFKNKFVYSQHTGNRTLTSTLGLLPPSSA